MPKKPTLKKRSLIYGEPSPNGRMLTMNNALTRAAHNLTLGEKRIVMLAISYLDSRKKPRFEESPMVRITAMDYAETFGVDLSNAYDQLKKAVKQWDSRAVTFYDPAFVRNGKPLKVTRMRWIGEYTYHDGEGWAEVHIWKNMVPFLMGLKRDFTQIQLSQTAALRSIYSWKMLELLMRFQSTGWARYTIEDFCESMGATEKQRSNFASIRRYMIEPAIKELTEKDNWVIEWHPIKSGRKVTSLHFTFTRNPQESLF